MLYIVWIWWLFRNEELAVLLPLGTETCLAQEWLCKRAAVAPSFAAVLKLRWCCEAKVPSASPYRGGFCHLSCPACASAAGKRFLKFVSKALQVFSIPVSIHWDVWSEQLCSEVRASCSVWSLGPCELFLQLKRWNRPVNQLGSCFSWLLYVSWRCCQEMEMQASVLWEGGRGEWLPRWGVGRKGC